MTSKRIISNSKGKAKYSVDDSGSFKPKCSRSRRGRWYTMIMTPGGEARRSQKVYGAAEAEARRGVTLTSPRKMNDSASRWKTASSTNAKAPLKSMCCPT